MPSLWGAVTNILLFLILCAILGSSGMVSPWMSYVALAIVALLWAFIALIRFEDWQKERAATRSPKGRVRLAIERGAKSLVEPAFILLFGAAGMYVLYHVIPMLSRHAREA
jgi:uncharacterized membrane protein